MMTSLVTNAYLYTGDERYKRWVLDYVDAWMERLRENGGIMPDNTGPSGKIGEQRQGQWWGGLSGWNSSVSGGTDRLFNSCTVAAECALLLSGDPKYLELIRSQIEYLLDLAEKDERGQLQWPARHGPDGWESFRTIQVRDLSHVYHASMSERDYDLMVRIRDGDVERDWNYIKPALDRRSKGGEPELPRFQYYDGQNPDWPMRMLTAEYQMVMKFYEGMLADERSVEQMIEDNEWSPNPVILKGLVQVTLGAPQTIYNGGLLRATVRYFDSDRGRPGLPRDVAALVHSLGPDHAGVHLVNTSATEERHLVIQAGAFGEHQFTGVTHNELSLEFKRPIGTSLQLRARATHVLSDKTVELDSKYLAVEMPPMSSIRLTLGMRRFANDPSYAFPWHGGTVPKQ